MENEGWREEAKRFWDALRLDAMGYEELRDLSGWLENFIELVDTYEVDAFMRLLELKKIS